MDKAASVLKDGRSRAAWLGGGLFLVAAWAGSAFSVRAADALKPKDWNTSSLLYLPSGKLLKPMALDFDEAAAGIIWVQGILYFADAYMEHRSYEWLGHILDVVTFLNPKFFPAYEFGGTVLARQKSEWPRTRALLERGIREFPEKWRLRVYLAMGYNKLDSNYLAAAEALKPLALMPEVPNHIRTMTASFLKKGGGELLALTFLVEQYLLSANAIYREIFVEKILRIFPLQIPLVERRGFLVEQILRLAEADPKFRLLAPEVLHEYLQGGEISGRTRRILVMLGQAKL